MARPSPRRHEIVGHTADIGLTATAPDLPSLFEEAALALAEVSADVDPRAGGPVHRGAREGDAIELEAEDQVALAYAWLNELIGLAQARGQALAGTEVRRLEPASDRAGWRLVGRARFVPFAVGEGPGARARLDVKSATYHRLTVRRHAGAWRLTAYLDV